MLKIGVIGCGKMGLHHIRAIQMQPSVQIVGVADPLFNVENVKEILSDKTPVFHDADTLFAETNPDVVHITTPPETHAALSKLALQYNAHVYIEKPFVPTEAEALELFELAEEKKRKLCPGHQVLYQKPALDARHSLHWLPIFMGRCKRAGTLMILALPWIGCKKSTKYPDSFWVGYAGERLRGYSRAPMITGSIHC